MVRIELNRKSGEYGFEATDQNGKTVITDNSADGGGNDNGFRPMQLLLAALGSCSAIDVVSILKKQRQVIGDFKIIIEAQREEKEIPALWKEINMGFELTGDIIPEKAIKACSLSVEKYCSVAETLRRAGTTIDWTLTINNEKINYQNEPVNL